MLRFARILRLLMLALLAAAAIQARAQTTVNLSAGWNLLGNSTNATLDVAAAFGDQANVNTVWKWVSTKSAWAFYAPSLAGQALNDYAASKGYDVLASVGPGEGFWVNARVAFAAQLPAGTAVQSASFQYMAAGWNLIAIGDSRTPSQFNNALNATPPSPGVIPNNVTTLWAWDEPLANWYFYAPSLEANGTLVAYIASKGYLNFESKVLGPTEGFWVNVPVGATATTTTTTTTTSAGTTTTAASTTTTTIASGGASGGAPAAAPVPTGPAPVTLSESTPAATLAALTPTVTIGGVSTSGPPVVTFAVSDGPQTNNAIIGLGYTSRSSTAIYPSLPNISFSLAKLVPGTNGAPSKWVSYIVTTVPTTVVASVPTRPSTDNTGTLVDNKNGTYTYTFFRDITKVKDQVAAAAVTAPNNTADLGDLTYDPTLAHRLTIQIGGNVRGTGTNTADGVQVTTGIPMANPVNVIYDFIPATGKAVTATDTQRDIVVKESCNECHGKLGGIPGSAQAFHGGFRYDPRYCAVCHTDQRRYGRTEATIANGTFSGSTYLVDGRAVGNLPNHIHKIHMGEMLVKKGYNYANVLYNEVRFPQDIRNCTKCHDGSATAANKTLQGDNWKNVPSRLACGACHDGIDFATGKGLTLADHRAGLTTSTYGHIGGAKSDDSQCALCHAPAAIAVYHTPVTPPDPANGLLVTGGTTNTHAASLAGNHNNLPQGAIKVTYEISSVSRNASKNPVMVFRMLQNGTAVSFNDKATKSEIWDNFIGSPSLYFAFAVPQDGVTAPADFNSSVSTYLKNLWNGTATGIGAGTLTGPDASSYYTATLTGATIPDSAVMLTGGMGYTYNISNTPPLAQTNLADYPVSPSPINAGKQIGGLVVVAPNVTKVATGYAGRRVIVENARCNKCHERLGVFTTHAFHGGQRNDAPTCSWCHTPNRTSSGWSADSGSYIHAIHAAAKRSNPFTWHASSTTESFANVGFPGVLKKCETCHLPGTYDFSAGASAAALPNRLYRTVGQGVYNGTAGATTTTYVYNSTSGTCVAGTSAMQTDLGVFSLSPYIAPLTNYGIGFSYNAASSGTTQIWCKADGTLVTNPPGGTLAADPTTLVNSPIAAACFSCHDSDLALQHMKSNGGSIYAPRDTALATTEMCALCHFAGKVADIKAMHAK